MADTRTPDVNAMAEAMYISFHQRADRVRSWATAPVEDIGPESGRMTWTFLASVAAAVPSIEERLDAAERVVGDAPVSARPAPATVTTTPGTATVPPVVHVAPVAQPVPAPMVVAPPTAGIDTQTEGFDGADMLAQREARAAAAAGAAERARENAAAAAAAEVVPIVPPAANPPAPPTAVFPPVTP